MMLKTLFLSSALALAAISPAHAGSITRTELQQQCNRDAPANVEKRVVSAVCECAMQYISAMKNGNDRFVDFKLEGQEDAALAANSVPVCLSIIEQVGPQKFFEVFEQTKAGVRDR